jgi:pimeloyl-ACP methyl ester carboxylesterase
VTGGYTARLGRTELWSPEYRTAQAAALAARRQAVSLLPRTWFRGLDQLLASLAIPGSRLVVMENGSHGLVIERAGEAIDLVVNFLRDIDGR